MKIERCAKQEFNFPPQGMEKDDLWLVKKEIKMIKEEMEQE